MSYNQQLSGIYNIVNTVNGSRYIGQTANLVRREHEHVLMLRGNRHDNSHLQNAVNKYGLKNFEFRTLEENVSPDCLTAQEQYWLDTMRNHGYAVYNQGVAADSPVRGRRHSPATIEGFRLARRGRKLTQEWKDKIAKSCKGINTKTHCPRGHLKTPENTYAKSTCRQCTRDAGKRQVQRLREARHV